jgi:hypothetical protein
MGCKSLGRFHFELLALMLLILCSVVGFANQLIQPKHPAISEPIPDKQGLA